MTARRWVALVLLPFLAWGTLRHEAPAPDLGYASVTPVGSPGTASAHSTGWSASFMVQNTSASTRTYTITCGHSGQVTCTGVDDNSVQLAAGGQIDLMAFFTTGDVAANNKVKLYATTAGVTDSGLFSVGINASRVTIASPSGAGNRLVVRTRQPVLRALFTIPSTDTSATVIKWRNVAVTSLARHNRGLIEWEVDSTRWLNVGDSAQLEVQHVDAGITTTETRWVVLENDSKPVLGFTGMPLEALNGGFSSSFGPGFSLNGAEIETGLSAIPYTSMGASRSAGLVYSTRTSYPRALVNVDLELPWPAGTPDQLKLYLFDGAVKMDSLILATPSCATGALKRCRATLQADFSGSTFATPVRKWLTVEAQVTSGATTKIGSDSVEVVLVDRRATQYGAGWWPSGISRLYGIGSDRMLIGPNGSATIFRGNGDSLYLSPPGSFTTLVKTASGFELRPRGSTARVRFHSDGRLLATVDNNGNKDSVVYVSTTDTVSTLIDPVGKTISFTYTSGRLSKITTLTSTAARDAFFNIDGTTNQLTYFRLPYTVSSDAAKLDTLRFTYQAYPGTKTNVITRRLGLLNDTTRISYDSTFKRRPVQAILPRVMDPGGSWVLPNIEYTAYERQGYGALRSLDSIYSEIKDPRDNWTRSLLNRWAQARKTWDSLGVIGRLVYDPDGFVLSAEGKNGDSSRVYTVYDSFRRVVKTYFVRTSSDTVRGDSLVYDTNHRVVKRINSLGLKDSMAYDVNGNLTYLSLPGSGPGRTWYRSDGLPDSVLSPGAASPTRFVYDAVWKQVTRIKDQNGFTLDSTTYDTYGRAQTMLKKVRVQVTADTTKWQWRKSVAYLTILNQVDSTALFRTNNCNDPCNTPPSFPGTNATTQRVRYKRDRAGRDSLRYNELNIATMYVFDRLGRLTSRRPWTDSMAVKDSMIYDVAGNLRTTITRRGQTISDYQDSRNRDTLSVIPGIGDVKPVFGGPQDQMTRLYLVNAVDAIGDVKRETRWGYNQRGQLVADTSYTGQAARQTLYTIDRLGRDSVVTDVNGVWRIRYDATFGLPARLVTPYSDSLAYSYDSQLRIAGPTIMSSGPLQTVTPTWTDAGELDKLEHVVSTSPTTFTPLTYNKGETDGEPSLPSIVPHWLEQHGMGAAKDTLRDSVNYDGWERVTSVVSFRASLHPSTVVSRDTFGFDRVGNILTTAGAEVYDSITGRLIKRTNFVWTDSMFYDRAGNLDSIKSVKAGATKYWGYDYDALNRLETVRQNGTLIARYSYDVLGRRITKRVYSAASGGTVGYTRYSYHGDQVAFDTDSASKIWRRYTWGSNTDDLIGVRDSVAGQALIQYYAVKDKLGNVRGLVKRDGTWQYSERFGPYGHQTEVAGSEIGLRYRWTGRELDPETGFYYVRARYYDPVARRFVQEDPIGFGGGLNLYMYVEGAVLSSTDPTGLLSDPDRWRWCDECIPSTPGMGGWDGWFGISGSILEWEVPGERESNNDRTRVVRGKDGQSKETEGKLFYRGQTVMLGGYRFTSHRDTDYTIDTNGKGEQVLGFGRAYLTGDVLLTSLGRDGQGIVPVVITWGAVNLTDPTHPWEVHGYLAPKPTGHLLGMFLPSIHLRGSGGSATGACFGFCSRIPGR